MLLSSYRRGIFLVSLSALIWSTVGLFAQGIDADVWVILFWRGLFSVMVLGIYVAIKSEEGIVSDFRQMGWPGWISTIVGALATICFISAFKFTSIANVSLIYAVVPFLAALLAWLLMRERATINTLVAASIALTGVWVMVSGSVGSVSLVGDLLAICMSIGMATLVVLFRMFPNRPMILSTLLSAVIHVALSFVLSAPFKVHLVDLGLLIGFGIVFSAATIAMIEGTRLIPASKSALISTAEAPLAPIWAWIVFMQIPTANTWAGGGLILFAVIWNLISENKPGLADQVKQG